MPITRDNQKTFHRTLYGPGLLETVRLLKRGDDQQEGAVTVYVMYDCRRSMITKQGNPIQGGMAVDHRCVWHIPIIEMERIGVTYLNVLDRIVDNKKRYWQPESGDSLIIKLAEQHYCVACVRIDPPGTSVA